MKVFGFFMFVMLITVATAQGISIFNPGDWYASQEAVMAVAALITPFIVKIFTALGKDWFGTDGASTQWLSVGVAMIVAGVGGYLSLGFLSGVSGMSGAISAAFMTLVAWLGANGMAKSDRQVATAAAKRIAIEMNKLEEEQ